MAEDPPTNRGICVSLPRRLLITGLGTGYLPMAPGTWGSAGACAVYLVVAMAAGGRQACLTGTMVLLAAGATVACGLLGPSIAAAFGRKDPSQCTLDEWAGQAVALMVLPVAGGWRAWLAAAGAAFLAFRVFDILKPPPIRQLERLPGGWGVVADDLAAGVYANVVVQLILRLAFRAG